MATAPEEPQKRPAGPGSTEPGTASEPERWGPLRVRRLRKADGRALLLYRWDPERPPGDAQRDG